MDKFDGFVDKLMKIHEESDKNYFHLEEKLLEMEEQRQRENQEFQVRMMSMLCAQPAVSSYNCQPHPGSSPYDYTLYNYEQTHQED